MRSPKSRSSSADVKALCSSCQVCSNGPSDVPHRRCVLVLNRRATLARVSDAVRGIRSEGTRASAQGSKRRNGASKLVKVGRARVWIWQIHQERQELITR